MFRLDFNEYFLKQGFRNLETVISHLIEKEVYSINCAFSFVLKHVKTNDFRFYHASNNNMIFEMPHLLIPGTNKAEELRDAYFAIDFEEYLKSPDNTKYILYCVLSQTIYVNKMGLYDVK